MRETLAVSERRACRVLGQVRRTQRYTLKVTDDETILTESIVSLASEYGRYGYRRITALLRRDGWRVNHKRGRLWFTRWLLYGVHSQGCPVLALEAGRADAVHRAWQPLGERIRRKP